MFSEHFRETLKMLLIFYENKTWLTECLQSSKTGMIEQVLIRNNMMRAYGQILSNKGSSGVDGMSVKELYQVSDVPIA